MTQPARKRGLSPAERRQQRKHIREYRRHKKNPCPHAPRQLDASTELFAEYRHHPHKRRNRWNLRLWWNEVNVDSDGFPIVVQHYKVRVEYTANGTDWFLHRRFTVPAKKDFDENETVHLVVRHIHPRLAYRYRVAAFGNSCLAEPSDWKDLDSAYDVPPAPHDVRILRAPHGIRLRAKVPRHLPGNYSTGHTNPAGISVVGAWLQLGDTGFTFDDFVKEFGPVDDTFFHKAVHHLEWELWNNADFGPIKDFAADAATNVFTVTSHGFSNGDVVGLRHHRDVNDDTEDDDFPAGVVRYKAYFVTNVTTHTFKLAKSDEDGTELDVTADGSGEVMWGFVRHAEHGRKGHHLFRIDADDFDEDQKFYGRVRSVSEHHSRSEWIPATAPAPNDDPGATPTGRRPAWHRVRIAFDPQSELIEGAVSERTTRLDDDYRIRRMIGTTGPNSTASGGHTKIDILVKTAGGSTWDSIFGGTLADMLTFADGDDDASTNALTIVDLERGDKLRSKIAEVTGAPPDYRGAWWALICDRRKGNND